MPEEMINATEILIPAQPLPQGAQAFTDRMYGLLDGQPKDDEAVSEAFEGLDEMFDLIAAGMYSIASMLVGEGEDSIRLVETAVANAELLPGQDPADGRKSSRRALCAAALDILASRDAASLAAPQGLEHAVTCIEDDELDAAGVSTEELERMIAGPDRDLVRKWLESLPTALRTIFVLRAVAGLTTSETAGLLAENGGTQAADWTPDAVRELFRQGLCSLASQVLHASHP
jgi:hypothetical protein